jgi:hypothetical protein
VRHIDCTRVTPIVVPGPILDMDVSPGLVGVSTGDSLVLVSERTGAEFQRPGRTLGVRCVRDEVVLARPGGIFAAGFGRDERLLCPLEGAPYCALAVRPAEGVIWAATVCEETTVYVARFDALSDWHEVARIGDPFEIVSLVPAEKSLVLTGSAHGLGLGRYRIDPSGSVRLLDGLPADFDVIWSDEEAHALVGLRQREMAERRSGRATIEWATDLRALDASEEQSADAGYLMGRALDDRFVICVGDSGRLHVVDVATGEAARLSCAGAAVTATYFECHPDGRLLLCHHDSRLETLQIDVGALRGQRP